MHYRTAEAVSLITLPDLVPTLETWRTKNSCDTDWGKAAFIVNTGQALASIPSDHQCSTQLSQGPWHHKIIQGNQHCIATLLLSEKFHEGYSISVIPCSLVSYWNPSLGMFFSRLTYSSIPTVNILPQNFFFFFFNFHCPKL